MKQSAFFKEMHVVVFSKRK